jgi:hypothetical protein
MWNIFNYTLFKQKLKGFVAEILSETIKEYIEAETSLHTTLLKEARKEAADYVRPLLGKVLIFTDRFQNLSYAVDKALSLQDDKKKFFLEFGVWKGYSLRLIAQKIGHQECFGFDSFEGLQEDWVGTPLAKGAFDLQKKVPKIKGNCKFYVGYFDKTLPEFIDFLRSQDVKQISFIHIDCDTYPSTKFVLNSLKDYIQASTILVFDEYMGYPGWKTGEFKAFQEFVTENQLKYEYLAFSSYSVTIKVL